MSKTQWTMVKVMVYFFYLTHFFIFCFSPYYIKFLLTQLSINIIKYIVTLLCRGCVLHSSSYRNKLKNLSFKNFFCLVNWANFSADSSPIAVAQLRLNVTPCLAYTVDQIWSYLVTYTGLFYPCKLACCTCGILHPLKD